MTPSTAGYQALWQTAASLDVSPRARIRATGEDRLRLLHAVASNAIEDLAPGSGTETFFLNPQGRIQLLARVYVSPDHVLLETAAEQRQVLLDYLESYIIMDDVSLDDQTTSTAAWAVEGPRAEALVADALGIEIPAEAPSSHVASEGLHTFRSTLTGQPGLWIEAPLDRRDEIAARLQSAGVVPASPEDFQTVRVENKIPLFGQDYSDRNIPHETGLLHFVSFSKGCYVGQEIVERVRSLGQVNRLLTPLALDRGELPSTEEIQVEGKTVGTLTSPVLSPRHGDVRGFSLLRRETTAPETALTVEGCQARIAG